MKLKLKNVLDYIETLDWNVTDDSEYTREKKPQSNFMISQYSPAGEDFSFTVDLKGDTDVEKIEGLVEEINSYYEDFDIDEHIEMLIEARKNGVGGVPTTSELVEDAKNIDEMLKKLSDNVENFVADKVA